MGCCPETAFALNVGGEGQSAHRAEVEGLLVVALALGQCQHRGTVHILADCQAALSVVDGGGSALLLSARASEALAALRGRIAVHMWWVPSHGKPAPARCWLARRTAMTSASCCPTSTKKTLNPNEP